MIFSISGTRRTVRNTEVSVRRDQTVLLNLIQSLPLQHRHHCKVDAWICPFSFHIKKVSPHLFVCFFLFRAKSLLQDWGGLRRFYNWGITQTMKKVIDRHVKVLFHGPNFTSPKHKSSIHHVRSSSSLDELDDVFIKYVVCLLFFLEKSTNQKTTRTSLERSF